MTKFQSVARSGTAGLMIAAFSACSSLGNIGNVLGGVLGGGGGGNQVQGTVLAVDTRSQYVALQQSDGQTLSLAYDNNTRVVYNNQNYAVTSLERGDQVTANVQQMQNGSYYVDVVQVDRSVSGSNGSIGGNTQSFQGTVRQVDYQNGWFTVDTNNGRYNVSMPYNARTNDVNTFRSLRNGQNVRFYGVYQNNNSIQLSQFF
jgi:exosome complex RNA-binding protein Csl4